MYMQMLYYPSRCTYAMHKYEASQSLGIAGDGDGTLQKLTSLFEEGHQKPSIYRDKNVHCNLINYSVFHVYCISHE